MSDESQTPVTPSAPAPVTRSAPASESAEVQSSESIPVETKSSESTPSTSSTSKEVKAEAAADKVGAEKVAADKFELKVDGEVLTLTKDEMIKYAQVGKAGQKRMQEAIEARKEALEYKKKLAEDWQKLRKELKENTKAVLDDPEIGVNREELAKEWLAEAMAEKAKSPEQKELEAERKKAKMLEERLAQIEKEKEEALAQERQAAEDRETQSQMEKMEKEIVDSFAKYKIPNSQAMLDRVVGIYEFARSRDIPATMEDCAKLMRDEIKMDIQNLASALTEEEFEELLGEAAVSKVKSATLKRKKSVNSVEAAEIAKVKKEEPKAKPKISIEDWITPDWAKD